MDDPLQIDGLDALPLPVVRSDRLLITRSNDFKRLDVKDWYAGISDRQALVPPQAADFSTWVNQDGATITDLADGFSLFHDNTKSSDSLMARVRAIPATSWDLRMGFVKGHKRKNFIISGLYLRESGTGKILTWGFAHAGAGGSFINAWSGSTSFSSTRFSAPQEVVQRAWYRAVKNGSNIDFYMTQDPSYWGDKVFSQALTTSFTTAPNQWGAFINPDNQGTPNVPCRLDAIDWSEA
jgi:hypothetical protein